MARGAERDGSRMHERWARLRFSIIGALLAAPPAKGALRAALRQLAAREWRHPSTGAPVRFGVSTLERWLYRARNERNDPVGVLRRKRRGDAGAQASMTPALREALLAQYGAHKSWSAAAPRQFGRPGRDPTGIAAGAILHNGSALPCRQRPDQASCHDGAPDRWRDGGRGTAGGARGARLRG
jgi:hypothetical protein